MACAVGSRADTKKKKQTSRPVCYFPHYLTEEHSLTMLCQYSGKLTSVIEFLKTIWLLSAWKSPKSKAQHFKKAQKPQSICRTALITGESTLNHRICQHEFIPDCITAWLCQSCRRSGPQKTCLVIPIFQTCAGFTKPSPLPGTVTDQPPLTSLSVATLTGKGQSCRWRYRLHPGYTNMQETFTHPECSGIPGLHGTC